MFNSKCHNSLIVWLSIRDQYTLNIFREQILFFSILKKIEFVYFGSRIYSPNNILKLMKVSLKSLTLICSVILSSYFTNAQELTVSNDEITRFINAIGPYTQVLKELQVEMADVTPSPEKMNQGKQRIMDTLAKYGWGEEYQDKSNAISQLYGIVGAENEAKNMKDDYQQSRLEAIQIEIDKYSTRYGEQSITNVRNRYNDLDAAFKALSME